MATISDKDVLLNMSLMAENKMESFKSMISHASNGSSLQSLVDTYRDSEQIEIHRTDDRSSSANKPKPDFVNREGVTTNVAGPRKRLKTDELSVYDPFSTKVESVPFERIECPDIPPEGYPKHYSIKDVLGNWQIDDTIIPPMHYDSLCHIDFAKDQEKVCFVCLFDYNVA